MTFGLHQDRAIETPDLTHRAVDRAGERPWVGIARTRAGSQAAREEGVDARIIAWLGIRRIAHVGPKMAHERADQRVLDRLHAAAGQPMDLPRQEMLRQKMLHRDEE